MLAEKMQVDAAVEASTIPAAELREVSKVYGTFAALRNLTVTFQPGSCTMILGENGAGKSTLLRLVAGLIEPSRGSVRVLGGEAGERRGSGLYEPCADAV